MSSVSGRNPPPVDSPFHAGEQAVQARLGVRDKIEAVGRRIIRPEMPKQHRTFFAQLPFVVLGVKDSAGQPWATLLGGAPGFVAAPTSTRLDVGAAPVVADPVQAGMAVGGPIALLGIELHSRRRNRANGLLIETGPAGFSVAVDQSFGNCPQYIQARHFAPVPSGAPSPAQTAERKDGLDEAARRAIAAADTFFIASAHPGNGASPAEGVDVSHRGGKPGFVKVEDQVLTVPDFLGNYLFNTLGNLILEPRAGLVFVDFSTGDLLHLAVDAEVVWDGPEVAAFAGAERLIRFHVREMARVTGSLAVRETGAVEPSPLLARTGSWSEAAALQAQAWPANTPRTFRIRRILAESRTVRTLQLEPVDGLPTPTNRPGQYLPIRLQGASGWLTRTYTLSGVSDGRSYQISVKRQGAASTHLHAAVVGDMIEAFPPRGEFVFDETSSRPAVLLSAGIGVTPMIAMLDGLLVNEGRSRHPNDIWFIHGARNGAEHPFAAHVRAKAASHANLKVHTAYSDPRDEDRSGRDYQSRGRLDLALLKRLLPFDDHDFYLCGPTAFMNGLHEGLIDLGVRPERIRTEAFGPSSLSPRAQAQSDARVPATSEATVQVEFRRSGGQALWRPAEESLLELAERHGLMPLSSCRAGVCGTCAVKVLAGDLDYAEPPFAAPAPGEALICCARPRPDAGLPSIAIDL